MTRSIRPARPATTPGYEYERAGEAGGPGAESVHERQRQERFWTALRKKVQAGARIKP